MNYPGASVLHIHRMPQLVHGPCTICGDEKKCTHIDTDLHDIVCGDCKTFVIVAELELRAAGLLPADKHLPQ